MALFDDIMDGLKAARDAAPDSDSFEAKAKAGTHEVDVVAGDFDRLGIKIHKLRVRSKGDAPPPRPIGQRLKAQGERLAQRQAGPLKDLKVTEIDGRLGGGLLRTAPEAMERGYFYEVELRGGDEAELRRLRRSPEGERGNAPFLSSDETFPELVEALREGLDGPSEA